MKRAYKILLSGVVIVVVLLAGLVVIVLYQHRQGIAKASKDYREYDPPQIRDFGSTRELSILPLVNWHAADPELKTEMGVSYLVKTDSNLILFDLGHNSEERNPSPLEHNMARLGIELSGIDIIFISHNHFDHVGGPRWVDKGSFSLGNVQKDLRGKKVFTPVPMTYPDMTPVYTPDPTVIADGVASTGAIPRQLFMGRIEEQALVINVDGRGLVLVVGCGHQKLPRIIERTEAVFEEPIYGIIGDLHYPVPEGRLQILGLNAQRTFASGEGPFNPLTKEKVMQNLELLQSRNLAIVGLGGHDSSDAVIEAFHNAFGTKYRYVMVGNWIEVSGRSE